MPQGSLSISRDRRRLEYPDGRPFFYLADTAWELFHRLSRDDAARYLADRAAKRFTVIQAVVLGELGGLVDPTPAGHVPLHNGDPTKPNEAYFADVDFVVHKAAELGLFIGMLPTWGAYWSGEPAPKGSAIFTPENAAAYGRFLGQRYRDLPIIWILGGDRAVRQERERAIIEAMAAGLTAGDGGRHLKTFHPIGQYSSAMWFHDAEWLDFNMIQTGHTRDRDNYNSFAMDFGRAPVKPILDGEPGYENISHAFDAQHGRLDAHQARKFCWWALFAGACGHTYGCNDIWQMNAAGRKPQISSDLTWEQALSLPGGAQMQHARTLIEAGPYFDRVPDPALIASANPSGPDHVQACRAPDGRYALIYIPTGQSIDVRAFLLLAPKLRAAWYNPRNGETKMGADLEVGPWSTHHFAPPAPGDWVLILTRD